MHFFGVFTQFKLRDGYDIGGLSLFKTGTHKTTMLTNDHKIVFHIKSQIVLIKFKKITSIKIAVNSPTLPPFFQTDLTRDNKECMVAPCPVAF